MIPIKLNNERVPGKNIKRFSDGTPMMKMIERACINAPSVDEVYVYCSKPEVQEFIIDGVQYLQRPDFLDTSVVNCNDIIREFMKVVDADVYIVSHATSPFTKSSSIEKCIQKVVSGEYDSAFLAKKLQTFLWQDGEAMNFDPQHFPRTQDLKPIYEESSGAFVFTKKTFLKYDRRVGKKPYICEVDDIEAVDIDNPIDFQIADAIYKGYLTVNIQINDCTIRDGGYLLAKNSPEEFIKGVFKGLLEGGIDVIENGFLQRVVSGESLVYGNSIDAQKYMPEGSNASHFTGFCDNSRFSLEHLDECDGKAFEYLKISFAKHEADAALEFVAGAKEKGYKVFANPMDAPSYCFEERSEMIKRINEIKPYAFSIVDTFGTMYLEDLRDIFTQMDKELDKSIRIGLHSHNNLQLSNALAEVMIDLAVSADRDIIVDSSLYSMGRGAGNASTEVIASYLNKKHGKNYNLKALINTIEKYIIPCRTNPSVDKWGYDLPMFVCGTLGAHVDNVFHMRKTNPPTASEMLDIIGCLDSGKRKRYGANYSKTDFVDLDRACEKYSAGR